MSGRPGWPPRPQNRRLVARALPQVSPWHRQWSLSSPRWWESAANAAQFFALLGAAAFFAVKVYQGYLTVDLSLDVACQGIVRSPAGTTISLSMSRLGAETAEALGCET